MPRTAVAPMVASSAARNKTSEAIAAAVPATARVPIAEVPFSSARKWSAVAFGAGDEPGGRPGGHLRLGAPTFRPALPRRGARRRGSDHASPLVGPPREAGCACCWPAGSPDTTDPGRRGRCLPPAGRCTALALVILRDVLRPDAAETLERFRERAWTSGSSPATTPRRSPPWPARPGSASSRGVISGPELEAMDDVQLPHRRRAARRSSAASRQS